MHRNVLRVATNLKSPAQRTSCSSSTALIPKYAKIPVQATMPASFTIVH